MPPRDRSASVATRQEVEAWRDRAFRRLPALRVRGEKSALQFVDEVGFCFTLSDFGLPVASLYVAVCGRRRPRWPKHTHHDPEIGLTWTLKDRLPAERLTYYGKLVKGKPTLVSLGLLPAFCALIREGRGSGDYIVDYRQGRMTRAAVTLLEALHEKGPLATPELRQAVALQDPDRAGDFDRAMAELQRGMWIVKVEEVYDPDFYYRWDLLDTWLPGPVDASLGMPRAEAVGRLVATYLRGAAASQPRFLAGLFGLAVGEVESTLASLEAEGRIRREARIARLPGSWIVWQGDAHRRD
ncbi:MAG TPA: crosslink repair DNA glycosylase YcaQ family protein [Candidatus Methylomirabilis sp.]|nr:crosslink repair DNA glycosylase YcaQ family protein [Candidatus Methylomirabilis sp.]HSC72501.1 crosslink repair DNA glycosylase YcaQ family protein [Candidatus Methylomirabilis sp.]